MPSFREMFGGLLGELWPLILFIVGGLVVAVGIWVGMSHMEAKSYNRVTGSSVSTWDAMWIDLRVQAGPKD